VTGGQFRLRRRCRRAVTIRRAVLVADAAAFITVTALVWARSAWLNQLDEHLSSSARMFGSSHPGWISAMRVVTLGGAAVVLIPLIAVALGVCLWQRRLRAALLLVCVLAIAIPVRLLLSTLVHRPRPVDGFTAASGWAYPSGHTTWAACTAIALAVALWPALRTRQLRGLVVAVAVIWPVAVAISRVALLAHWPSDVVGAILYATMAMALLAYAVDRLLARTEARNQRIRRRSDPSSTPRY
jgi:membrane-associated phospholipid phosphatase